MIDLHWYVYLIQSTIDNSIYCGITTNVQSRLIKHNKGKGAKYTKGRAPFLLLKSWLVSNKSIALKVEFKIKKLSKQRKLKLIAIDDISMFFGENMKTLGERCVEFALNEMANNVGEDKPKSYTSPRLREYFSITTRLINNKEVHVNMTSGNWCAAGVSFCLKNSLLKGEKQPHGFRLGVVEIVADLQKNKLYVPVSEVRNKQYKLHIGDPIIFDRSTSDPATSWWRHIGLVKSVSGENFECISGNSNGKWRVSTHNIQQKNILGFGSYSQEVFIEGELLDELIPDLSNVDILSLNPTIDSALDIPSTFSLIENFKQNSKKE